MVDNLLCHANVSLLMDLIAFVKLIVCTISLLGSEAAASENSPSKSEIFLDMLTA